MKHLRHVLLSLMLLFIFGQAIPCGWDYDTVKMERQAFPTVLELITGKFLRHSSALYYWRVKDRTDKLKAYPDSLHYYDDLGVAYDKIGEHENAIQAMLDKEKLSPGLYETYANLGTFYIHNGQYEEGLTYIKKAIEINPEAHFGREVYQQYLVEYIISKRDSVGASLPLAGYKQNNFYHFLKERHFRDAIANGSNEQDEISKAIKGVAGMMRFGHFDSPVLLEAIGDLLSQAKSGHGASGHLASRAYLKASYELKDENAKAAYERLAKASREEGYNPMGHSGTHAYSMRKLHYALKWEIKAGDAWYDSIRTDEMNWIKAGLNPDSAFSAKYYEDPEVKAVGHRSAGAYRDKTPESYWLERQYSNPEAYVEMYKGMELPDSAKALLDSMYMEHFAPPVPDVDTTAVPGETGTTDTVEEEEGYNLNAVLIFGGIVLVIGGFLVYRDYKRSREDKDA